ncbi:FAD-binding protein [Aneurinibacillus sp. BA2021]|nr:FAD-binding protein [Aneurinibacillus sp. BA2021]
MAVTISSACISCGTCVDTCPVSALYLGPDQCEVDTAKCEECTDCIPVCPTEAISLPNPVKAKAPTPSAPPVSAEKPEKKTEPAPAAQASAETEAPKAAPQPEKRTDPFADHEGVWVFIDQTDGVIAGVSLELLGAGRRLADKLNTPLSGFMLGHHIESLAQTCFEYGADQMYIIDDPVLKDYRSETYMKGTVDLCNKYKPEIILYGATINGKDLASAVATDLATGLTADCTMLDVEPQKRLLEASRPAFGGNIMATILCKNHRPQMATVRSKVMKALEPQKGRQGTIIHEPLGMHEADLQTKVLDIVRETGTRVKLDEAHIIVAGGKGLGDAKGFQICYDLAEVLGASVGASRDAVEAGWIDHHYQIGQTGVTVTPKIYFAIAISGAVQHIVGMQNSEFIIAINKDPDAPIHSVATYSIIGDAFDVVPKLIEAFKKVVKGGEEVHV